MRKLRRRLREVFLFYRDTVLQALGVYRGAKKNHQQKGTDRG